MPSPPRDKVPDGVVVPIPTFPALVTTKSVFVDDPIAKAGPVIPFGFTESCAQGVVDPTPIFDPEILRTF